MDYNELRAESLERIQRLSGGIWTDYNTHDPGVTILEQLCYALTDLNYRIGHEIQDLLADSASDRTAELFGPAQVLVTAPVTENDQRKIVLDVPGVRNAWVDEIPATEPELYGAQQGTSLWLRGGPLQRLGLRGIRRVRIAAEPDWDSEKLRDAVRARLHAGRALAEDFGLIEILPLEEIRVDARVEIAAVDDPDRVLTEIYRVVANHISPRLHFDGWRECAARGKTLDQIFEGPLLNQGWIDDAELETHQKRTALRKSDLIQVIMDVAGVVSVREIQMSTADASDGWYFKLDPNRAPVLQAESQDEKTRIQLVRGKVPVHAKRQASAASPAPLPWASEIVPPAGRDRHLEKYYSIQHQFPEAYGIGGRGLPPSDSPLRSAQARQLKAYLCLFEQLLANAFSQLAHAKDLFSFDGKVGRTYFAQALERVVPDADWAVPNAELQALVESDEVALARRHRFLNHMLARFGEEMTEFTLLVEAPAESRNIVRAKESLLRDLPRMGGDRGRGFNAIRPAELSDNCSGLERRIRRKLGLNADVRGWLASEESPAGFHLLEHILLRPERPDFEQWENGDCSLGVNYGVMEQPIRPDPYSGQISFVFPAWAKRVVDNPAAQAYVGKILREETPAHLHVHLQWLKPDGMRQFESALSAWQTECSNGAEQSSVARNARDEMINLLGIGRTWPRRDLELISPEMCPAMECARIEIKDPQWGVAYQLCDQDGSLVPNSPAVDTPSIDVSSSPQPTTQERLAITVVLKTPPISENCSFTILASRLVSKPATGSASRLETYLNRTVRIRSGINRRLNVEFMRVSWRLGDSPDPVGSTLTIDHGGEAYLAIQDSQEGVTYEVCADGASRLSDPVVGKGQLTWIYLRVSNCQEDLTLKVRAFPTAKKSPSENLDAELRLRVRPNPKVQVQAPELVDHGADVEFTLTLSEAQESVRYDLYSRRLAISEFLPLDEPNGPDVAAKSLDANADYLRPKIESDQAVGVRNPLAGRHGDDASGFAFVASFDDQENDKGPRTVVVPRMLEDLLFIVRAKKDPDGESLWLDQACVVVVRPNVGVKLSARPASVEQDHGAMCVISEPQRFVRYQLQDLEGRDIGAPGYHPDERGIGRARIDVDFAVADKGTVDIQLPTGPLAKLTRFQVKATKYVGSDSRVDPSVPLQTPLPIASTMLMDKVTIEIEVH